MYILHISHSLQNLERYSQTFGTITAKPKGIRVDACAYAWMRMRSVSQETSFYKVKFQKILITRKKFTNIYDYKVL